MTSIQSLARVESVAQKESRFLLQIYDRYPLVVTRGCGCYIFDSEGNRYLDAIAGIGVNALGYSHPRIIEVLVEQAQQCIHTSNLVYHPYQGELAQRLCALSGLDRVFFSSSGTEAMEAALKAVRVHGRALHLRKTKLVALSNSFHGRTFGSLAITGQPKYQMPFGPLAPQVTFVDPNDNIGLAKAVTEDTAGIILEPVLGEGGIFPVTVEFLQLARELATRHRALFVADEIQCGLGRTGRYFAYETSGILPDIVVTAKPLAAGLPLAATMFTEQAAQNLPVGLHGTTFGGGPLACRVALEFFSILDELLPNVREIGERLRAGLEEIQRRRPIVTEIRSAGLMLAIQLSRPGHDLVLRALERGLLVNCTHDTVLRLLPSYILSIEQADELLRILDDVLDV
ncbi:MAG TPA: acetylornithine/succinylornithine family transaminase [Bryobacteraceae bacterium]|nr:acetylornithine/succinylornithine family transaminase [Bryobacteraceae bacterium]